MEKLYSCDEIAERYKVKISTVWSWIRKGLLSAKRIGKFYRISETSLKKFESKK